MRKYESHGWISSRAPEGMFRLDQTDGDIYESRVKKATRTKFETKKVQPRTKGEGSVRTSFTSLASFTSVISFFLLKILVSNICAVLVVNNNAYFTKD